MYLLARRISAMTGNHRRNISLVITRQFNLPVFMVGLVLVFDRNKHTSDTGFYIMFLGLILPP
jgi:hypothetical protein